MEFGKVLPQQLEHINFTLPADPAFNKQVLNVAAVKNPKVYIGCARWGEKEWVGKLYPLKTSEKNFPEYYVRHYNTIELNATHYKIYDANTIARWAERVEHKDFLFCPKMYNGITHEGNLYEKEMLTREFLQGLINLNEHLGPVFIQFSEAFSPARKQELFNYLQTLPTNFQFFVEVRHPDWFSNAVIKSELFSHLRQLNIGAVITDAAGRRDCVHMFLPISKAFIRYVGNSAHATDCTRMDEWVQRIKCWLDNGLQELYFFVHDRALSPQLSIYLIEKLNTVCNLNIQKPVLVPQQPTLFG